MLGGWVLDLVPIGHLFLHNLLGPVGIDEIDRLVDLT